jgi:hypothetical protein
MFGQVRNHHSCANARFPNEELRTHHKCAEIRLRCGSPASPNQCIPAQQPRNTKHSCDLQFLSLQLALGHDQSLFSVGQAVFWPSGSFHGPKCSYILRFHQPDSTKSCSRCPAIRPEPHAPMLCCSKAKQTPPCTANLTAKCSNQQIPTSSLASKKLTEVDLPGRLPPFPQLRQSPAPLE